MYGLDRQMGGRGDISSMSLRVFGIYLCYRHPNAGWLLGDSLRPFRTFPHHSPELLLIALWILLWVWLFASMIYHPSSIETSQRQRTSVIYCVVHTFMQNAECILYIWFLFINWNGFLNYFSMGKVGDRVAVAFGFWNSVGFLFGGKCVSSLIPG